MQQEYIHESGLNQFDVVKADFDAGGKWLATVEERKQNSAELELNLKLWAFDEQTQRYADYTDFISRLVSAFGQGLLTFCFSFLVLIMSVRG